MLRKTMDSPTSSHASSRQPSPSSSASITSSTNSSNARKALISTNWTCEDCVSHKRPLYGDIVWAKVGNYRWWPAQIIRPCDLPENIKDRHRQVGEFPVQFFGSHDYYWVNIGRCFVFAEGDELNLSGSTLGACLVQAYKRGVRQAIIAFQEVQRLKMIRVEKSGGTKDAYKLALSKFQFIKSNRPVGNVSMPKVLLADLPICDCDPRSANPCGTDDCMNRMLKYECNPAVCRAGERCQNQRFVKRLYPKQEPVPTGMRGWGLRTLENIKKGDFVNEYVGELIDDVECKRRFEKAHQDNITNFYFLTLEKDRIIDAGPKGNLSRFMNHSCDPNVETQKWLVNGDVRVGLFALSDIPASTELTFNYNLDCLSNEKAVCRCGAKKCSGFIGERLKPNGNVSNLDSQSSSSASSVVNVKKRKLNEAKKGEKALRGSLEPQSLSKLDLKNGVKKRSNSATPKVADDENTKKKAEKSNENLSPAAANRKSRARNRTKIEEN